MNVMVPDGFSRFRSAIVSPALKAIADHWQQVRGDRPMPAWSDLSPTSLGPHLKLLWTFRYDRATGEFAARLAGNRVMMCLGDSFRGTPLRKLYKPDMFEKAHADFSRIVLEPALAHANGKLFKVGESAIQGERIALPMATDGHHGDGVLGASDFKYQPAAGSVELLHCPPVWFSI